MADREEALLDALRYVVDTTDHVSRCEDGASTDDCCCARCSCVDAHLAARLALDEHERAATTRVALTVADELRHVAEARP